MYVCVRVCVFAKLVLRIDHLLKVYLFEVYCLNLVKEQGSSHNSQQLKKKLQSTDFTPLHPLFQAALVSPTFRFSFCPEPPPLQSQPHASSYSPGVGCTVIWILKLFIIPAPAREHRLPHCQVFGGTTSLNFSSSSPLIALPCNPQRSQ